MKRLAAAGTFTLLAGAFGLLLLASIVFSCRQGGTPHEMGATSPPPTDAHASVAPEDAAPDDGTRIPMTTAHRA